MVQINSVKDDLKVEPIDAKINDDTIIPGINGKVVNVDVLKKKYQVDFPKVGMIEVQK